MTPRRWTLWLDALGRPVGVKDFYLWREAHSEVEVMPVPDERALSQAATEIASGWEHRGLSENVLVLIAHDLLAALEDR